jgi:DNA-binding CsgD family transcriptional regulator
VSFMVGFHGKQALTVRARVALAERRPEIAERDVHEGIAVCAAHQSPQGLADLLECLAEVAGETGGDEEGARLLGAASTARTVTHEARFKIYDAAVATTIDTLRAALGDAGFDRCYAEGTAMSPEEAITYARRGRGERKRPASGWSALTPAELDVVRLLAEGLPNKDIAHALFVSPRTVQSHLTHVYAKLGLSTRVQLAKEADRRARPAS